VAVVSKKEIIIGKVISLCKSTKLWQPIFAVQFPAFIKKNQAN
jgi:hypothetical protein